MPRRPRPQRVLRRPLPRGVSDARRRGAARRRALLLRRRLGVSRARQPAHALPRSRWNSTTSIPARGATSNESNAAHLAAEESARMRASSSATRSTWQVRRCRSWSARRAQRGPDRKGRRADRLRPRLPRRHLRLLRLHDQRRRPRPQRGHHRLPVDHAPLQGRGRAGPRAVARCRLPRHQGSGRRPPRLRPHHRRRRLHLRLHRERPDGNTHLIGKETADRAMDAAACIGCGACVAACPNASPRSLPGPRSPISASCPRASPSATAAPWAWLRR